jgi:hypothetical protein
LTGWKNLAGRLRHQVGRRHAADPSGIAAILGPLQ